MARPLFDHLRDAHGVPLSGGWTDPALKDMHDRLHREGEEHGKRKPAWRPPPAP